MLISAAIAVVLFGVSFAGLYFVSVITHVGGLGRSAEFAVWGMLVLLYIGALAVWGRSPTQRITSVIVTVICLGLCLGITIAYYIDPLSVDEWADPGNFGTRRIGITLLIGSITGWSVARRRTPAALIGVLPAVGVVWLGGWPLTFQPPDLWIPWDVAVYATMANWAAFLGIAFGLTVLGILLVWACDGIGLLLRRDRPRPPQGSRGVVAPYGHGPGWHGHPPNPQPWPPHQPPGWPPQQ
jgi:hypothetical protein